MSSTDTIAKKAFKVFMALILALGLSPLAGMRAFAGPPDEAAADAQTPEETIEAMLSAGEYADGQAIVVMSDGEASASLAEQADDESESLLAGATSLMQVEGQAVAEAAGEANPAGAQDEAALLAAEEDGCSIVLVESDTLSTRELLAALIGNPRVVSAEPNYIYTVNEDSIGELAAYDADDTARLDADAGGKTYKDIDGTPYQWGFENDKNSGYLTSPDTETSRIDGFDVGLDGWNSYDDSGTPIQNATGVVAVVDMGIDYENPDLANIMIKNAKSYVVGTKYENSPSSLDNGYDAVRTEASKNEYSIMDYNGHGTHVAGIVGAEWNGYGTSGAASGIELLGVRVGNAAGAVSTSAVLEGYDYLSYAVKGGMELVAVNNSWTSNNFVTAGMSIAVAKLGRQGVVSIFGSGNDKMNTDSHLDTPFGLANNPYAVSVNAVNYVGNASMFSNWGVNSSNVYAPGTAILSTKSKHDHTGYTGIADPNTLVQETFVDSVDGAVVTGLDDVSTSTMSAKAPKADGSDLNDFAVAEAGVWSVDSTVDCNSGSLRLDMSKFKELDAGRAAVVYVKVNKANVSKIKFLSMAIRNTTSPNDTFFTPILRQKGSTGNDVALLAPSSSQDESWNSIGQSVDVKGFELATVAIPNDNDNVYLPFGVFVNSVSTDPVYVDELCAGETDTFWKYDSGTSMATPAVTGCAAIVAKRQGTLHFNDDLASACAIERADILKSSVIDVNDEAAYPCSQSGMVNLKVQDDQKTPVIRTATRDASGTLTIKGSWFGDNAGTVSLDGITADVVNWNRASITIKVPSGLTSGVFELQVKGSNGKVGKRSIPLETTGVKAFPNELTPFDSVESTSASGYPNFNLGTVSSTLCTLDGVIYSTEVNGTLTSTRLLAYDTADDTWSKTAPFPVESATQVASVTVFRGKVFAAAFDISTNASYLMTYDPATDSWTSYDTSKLRETTCALGGTLISAKDSLLLIGGMDCSTGETYARGAILELTLSDDGNAPAITKVTPVGDLANDGIGVKAVVHNGSIYVGNGSSGSVLTTSPNRMKNSTKLQCLDYDGKTWKATDISNTLPKFLAQSTGPGGTEFGPNYGLAATSQGIVISGARVDDGTGSRAAGDTYILRDGSNSFDLFTQGSSTYSASLGELFFPASISCNGTLYTMGMTLYADSETAMSFRSISLNETAIEVPQAVTDLVYTGEEQVAVKATQGCIVEGGSATDPGDYQAVATLEPGYVWKGGDYEALAIPFSIAPAPEIVSIRLSGPGRYDTMHEIVKTEAGDVKGAPVVLATGGNFPDALAASGLAGLESGSIVLTEGEQLSTQAKAALDQLKPSKIYIAGGEDVVSIDIDKAVKALGYTTQRVAGTDRIATAEEIYEAGCAIEASWGDTCIISTAYNYADALAASPMAYAKHYPIFLAGRDGLLTASTTKAIKDAGFKRVIIVGGIDVVSDDVKAQIGLNASQIIRLAGETRYETATAIVEHEISKEGMNCSHMAVATGANYPDALSGSSLCGSTESVMCLIDGKKGDVSSISGLIAANKRSIEALYILGGEDVVSKTAKDGIDKLLAG